MTMPSKKTNTLVNSLAKVFDNNILQNQVNSGSSENTKKPADLQINTLEVFDVLEIKVDFLGKKIDKMLTMQEQVLQNVDIIKQELGEATKDIEVLKADKKTQVTVEQKGDQGNMKELYLGMSSTLSEMNKNTEEHFRRIDGMEKMVLSIQQLFTFFVEGLKTSKLLDLISNGWARSAKDKKDKKHELKTNKIQFDSRKEATVHKKNGKVKSNKAKERREKPGFSLKGVKTLKKRRSVDCSDISSQKNLNDFNAEKVNKLNKENAKKSSSVIIAQQNILKADKPSRDVLEHNENKKGLAKTQTLREKLHVDLEGDALEYEKSTKKVNDASIFDISSNSHASADDTQEDQGKIKASKEASNVNIQIEDGSCQSAAKELDITVEEEDAEAEEDEAEEEEEEEEEAMTESDDESTPEEDSEEKERSSEETTEDDDTETKQNENSVVHVNESSTENVPAPVSECQNVTHEVLHRKSSLKMYNDENENRESHFKSPTESQRSNLENDNQSSLNDQNSNSKLQVTEEELRKESTKESQNETNNNQVVKQDEERDLSTVIEYSSPLPAPFDHRIVSAKSAQIVHQYHINKKEFLGGGRFGEVHKCTEKGTGLKFAAKTIKARGTKEKEEVKNEINVMNQLNHVNLLQLYDAYESKNDIILILELVEGGELFDRILDKQYNLSELDTIHFIKQICEGIQHMHQMYILHLDLKPENILCVNQATNQIKIIDFGLARPYKPREKLKVNFGTPEFLAPEVVNYEFVSFPTDMWSVGVIAYMLLSGLSPFLGDDDNETLNNIIACKWDFEDEEFQHVSEEAKDFITKLLVKGKSWRISATESLKHRWITDGKLHSRLKQQWKNMNCSMSKAPNDEKK